MSDDFGYRESCPTERKLWARIYARVFGCWPAKVVNERLAWTAASMQATRLKLLRVQRDLQAFKQRSESLG